MTFYTQTFRQKVGSGQEPKPNALHDTAVSYIDYFQAVAYRGGEVWGLTPPKF
jgi:hypothetical protein